MNALEEMRSLSGSVANPAIENWKREGGKVVGYFCSYVPEEVLHAAGILPYRIRPAGCAQTTSADVYFSHVNCTFVRSCLQFALEGRYKFLDGLIFVNTCDHMRRLYDLWREKVENLPSFVHFVQIPHKSTDEAIAWYKDEVMALKEHVERAFGVGITEARLRDAVQIHNETRGLLRRLYELRRGDSPPISGAETLSVVLAATVTPKQQYNQLLKRLLEELAERKDMPSYRARLMIAGSAYDDPVHAGIIEDLGGLVVTDTLCYGSRYFWETVEVGDDLWLSLARYYLTRSPCARMSDKVSERNDFVRMMVERFNVDGVVYQRLRYCDLWGSELFNLRAKLKEVDIPVLFLEREYALGGAGQLETRVQAFLEQIGR